MRPYNKEVKGKRTPRSEHPKYVLVDGRDYYEMLNDVRNELELLQASGANVIPLAMLFKEFGEYYDKSRSYWNKRENDDE